VIVSETYFMFLMEHTIVLIQETVPTMSSRLLFYDLKILVHVFYVLMREYTSEIPTITGNVSGRKSFMAMCY
jgi:hypothetical protein